MLTHTSLVAIIIFLKEKLIKLPKDLPLGDGVRPGLRARTAHKG